MSEAKNMEKGQNWPFFETMGNPPLRGGNPKSAKIEDFLKFLREAQKILKNTPKLVINFREAKI